MKNKTVKMDPLVVQIYKWYMGGFDLCNAVVANLSRHSIDPGPSRKGNYLLADKEIWDEVTDKEPNEGTLKEFVKKRWKSI